jgi:hypothetical protein
VGGRQQKAGALCEIDIREFLHGFFATAGNTKIILYKVAINQRPQVEDTPAPACSRPQRETPINLLHQFEGLICLTAVFQHESNWTTLFFYILAPPQSNLATEAEARRRKLRGKRQRGLAR